MPITPFLSKQVFEPELIEAMSAAFIQGCSTLGLADRTDPITEIVARKVIEAAMSGLRTPTALYKSAMQELSLASLDAASAQQPNKQTGAFD